MRQTYKQVSVVLCNKCDDQCMCKDEWGLKGQMFNCDCGGSGFKEDFTEEETLELDLEGQHRGSLREGERAFQIGAWPVRRHEGMRWPGAV